MKNQKTSTKIIEVYKFKCDFIKAFAPLLESKDSNNYLTRLVGKLTYTCKREIVQLSSEVKLSS